MFYKKFIVLLYLCLYVGGRSIWYEKPTASFTSVPDIFFLNVSKGNITVFQNESVYVDSLTLKNKDLTLKIPPQLINITDPYIRDAVISNATFTVLQINKLILNQKFTSCQQFFTGNEKFIGEAVAFGAMGVAAYAIVRVNEHEEHFKKLDQLLYDLERNESNAIEKLQKDVLINQINFQVFQILNFEKEDMLLFLNQIFHPYLIKTEAFPTSISIMIKKQAEGVPNFYKADISDCDVTEVKLSVSSYFGKNPMTLELIKVETMGWFVGDNYVEPHLNGLMAFHDNFYKTFDESQCIHNISSTGDDYFECLKEAVWYNPWCNLHNYLNCAAEKQSVDKNFVKWKELDDLLEIVTKVSDFSITNENGTKLYFDVPQNGKFLVQLNKNETIEIGPVVIHGKSDNETSLFIRESEISDLIDNVNIQIERNNNFTKIVKRKTDELEQIIKEDNKKKTDFDKLCDSLVSAGISIKDAAVAVYEFVKNNFILTVILSIAFGMFLIFAWCSCQKCCCSKAFGK